MDTNRIEKKIFLRATRERAWQAISDARRFGTWFGVVFDGAFVAGEWVSGTIVPTKLDREIAETQKPVDGLRMSVLVERIEPMARMTFRWHPFAIDPKYDYAQEPTTCFVFELTEADGGILLTITETGFDQLPIARRAKVLLANDQGWADQIKLVEKYLALEERV